TSADVDYYELLGLEPTATAAEIKRAYRWKALLCHPDKVGPDDLKAASLFHQLTEASQTLSNEASRRAYDDLHKARRQQQARFKEMDAQRQKTKRDLDESEAAWKRQRTGAASAELQRKMDMERLREEGFASRQALEQQRRQAAAASVAVAQSVQEARAAVAAADLMDCTVRIKWKRGLAWEATEDSLRTRIKSLGGVAASSLDRILVAKSGKRVATVVFRDLYGAYAVMQAKQQGTFDMLRDLTVEWAAASPPKALAFMATALLSSDAPAMPSTAASGTATPPAAAAAMPFPRFMPTTASRSFMPASFPMANSSAAASTDEYEELTLRRMRQTERETLERE
ncbi:hypothetical protein BC831DRAFT_390204, partial [Entophlyctis helioformis]